MVRGNCLSFGEVAKLLGVSSSAVKDRVRRAERKIAQKVAEQQLAPVS